MREFVTVALIGDSIRLQAEPFVRARLPPRFRVRSPADNCRSSHEVAAWIRKWVPPGSTDIVHVNCGLHDIRRDPGEHRPVSSLAEYGDNLRSVFTYLADVGVAATWATSTPVSEDMPDDIDLPRWRRTDLVEYNRLSVELAREFGFRVNDLHGRLSRVAEPLHLADGVHFNRSGNLLIGRRVAAAIRSCDA